MPSQKWSLLQIGKKYPDCKYRYVIENSGDNGSSGQTFLLATCFWLQPEAHPHLALGNQSGQEFSSIPIGTLSHCFACRERTAPGNISSLEWRGQNSLTANNCTNKTEMQSGRVSAYGADPFYCEGSS